MMLKGWVDEQRLSRLSSLRCVAGVRGVDGVSIDYLDGAVMCE